MEEVPSRRRRVLIVVSAWCPAMIADMQRARLLAWELPKLGWDVEILTPRAAEIRQDVVEPNPAGFFAPDTPVHEVGSVARGAFEALGSQTHAWRTWLPMRRQGRAILCSRRFDLVYFTTTTFVYFYLGPRWLRQSGIPYVLDFHDPWVKAHMADSSRRTWRSRLSVAVAAPMERDAVISASGIVSVSPNYVDSLRRRYITSKASCLAPGWSVVIPFGAREEDFGEATSSAPKPVRHDREEIAVRYVGAGGAIMIRSFDLLCRAMDLLRQQGNPHIDRVRIELYGTIYGWKRGESKPLEDVARRAGVADIVNERPERISYRRSLELLLDADGALILGVDDAGYMPSKLVSYALSGKPLLASLHRESPAFAQFRATPDIGQAIWFEAKGTMQLPDAARAVASFVEAAAAKTTFDRQAALQPFLAPNMARRHADLFDACVDRSP